MSSKRVNKRALSGRSSRTGRWRRARAVVSRGPGARRARVRVRVGRFLVVGRVARVAARANDPPGAWGVLVVNGRVGYGRLDRRGRVAYWRPLSPG